MLNQYVNLTPQQKMAQMLQQQAQPTQLQGDMQQQMPQAQNPFGGVQDAMKMYQQASQRNQMQDYQDYMARMKLAQSQTGGMFDRGNAVGPDVTANNYTG
jgi:hypothetical protein